MAKPLRTFVLRSTEALNSALDFLRSHAREAALSGAPLLVHVFALAEQQSRTQQEKYHAMFGDIAAQCAIDGVRLDVESFKRLLIDQFVTEMRQEARATGAEDPFPAYGHLMRSLDQQRLVQLGVQSREFTKYQGNCFVEYLYCYGAECGVRWSQKSLEIIDAKK